MFYGYNNLLLVQAVVWERFTNIPVPICELLADVILCFATINSCIACITFCSTWYISTALHPILCQRSYLFKALQVFCFVESAVVCFR